MIKKTLKKRFSDLGLRLISALFLVPLAALLLYLGGIWFAILIALVFAIIYREFEIMINLGKIDMVGYLLSIILALSALLYPFYQLIGTISLILLAIFICFIASLFLKNNIATLFWRIGGIIYFGTAIIAIMTIRSDISLGIVAGVFIATSVWMTDTGAFFAGRLFGGAKLSPDISPSKTWSGAIGGLIVGAVSGSLVWIVAVPSIWWVGAIFAALISISGQIGDLLESAVKRRFKIKDSSDLIPGHGGLLDRLDSLTLAVIVILIISLLRSGDFSQITNSFLLW